MTTFNSSPSTPKLAQIIDRLPLKSDKFTRHNYLDFYEEHLPPFREALNVVEVGVHRGASLAVWHEYFPRATIWGVDVRADMLAPEVRALPRVRFIHCNIQHLNLCGTIGAPPDVVIDDGSHKPLDRMAVLTQLEMGGCGLLVIEDVENVEDVPYTYAERIIYHGGRTADDNIVAFKYL